MASTPLPAHSWQGPPRSVSQRRVRSCRETLTKFATMRTLDVWYARLEADDVIERIRAEAAATAANRLQRDITKARARDSQLAYSRLTTIVDGEPRIAAHPPLVVPADQLLQGEARDRYIQVIGEFLTRYRALQAAVASGRLEAQTGV